MPAVLIFDQFDGPEGPVSGDVVGFAADQVQKSGAWSITTFAAEDPDPRRNDVPCG
ncbi:hypothetical protein [Arthrobacter sp. MMS18-M83]|uniref:hypothetical protein n=1 Tax=Arthrobacter sp. MMS18-M83 TaxID=2996261 RepID=UPI00227C238E|nr:hypothetical protein [Arthrobacter sp. MMS18-M83]WAH97591.1 hypothetical protein OW521_01420 [Arthrobacter sp. MMS18-M83]